MYSPNRINLLSVQEIEAIYAIPEFNKAERELYFSLTDEEMLLVKKYRTAKAQIYFIRLLGHFTSNHHGNLHCISVPLCWQYHSYFIKKTATS